MPMLHFDLDELFEDLIPEEKSKKQNSTDTTHKEKNGGIGGEVPQAQQPQGFATPPNNSTESTDSTEMVETRHTPAEEALIQSYINWVNQCKPGDEWQIPQDWLPDSDELRLAADEEIRKRNPNLRVWRTGENKLACKVWFGPEPPSYRPPRKSKPRFRGADSERIQTMWSEEYQSWCRWDATLEDYVVDPELNRESK